MNETWTLRKFKKKWQNCDKCLLHTTRHKMVPYRGSIPADILFIGEAPGLCEDVLGKPFVGPAGNLLDMILEDALSNIEFSSPTYCITNTVCCIPKDPISNQIRQPHKEEISICQERLVDFIALIKPQVIITVGKIAKQNLPQLPIPFHHIIHPAALLPGRMQESRRGIEIRRTVHRLTHIINSTLEETDAKCENPKTPHQ